MGDKQYNRLKKVLKEQRRTGKWLAKKLNKNEITVSRWSRNVQQPSLITLYQIAEVLDVHVCELISKDFPDDGMNKNN